MNGTTVLAGSGNIGTLGAGWAVAGTGDFNGDGKSDVLLAERPAARDMGDERHDDSGRQRQHWALGAGWAVAGTGDFNGDGKSDIC